MTSATPSTRSMTQPALATTTSSKGMTTSSPHRSDNIIRSERFVPIGATVNPDYLNISFVECFSAIGATVNENYDIIVIQGLYSTNGETTKTSRNGVNEEERYNSNGETANNSGDFFDDFLNSRWCGGETITPRGGVKQPCALCLGSSVHPRKDACIRGSNTTTTTMVAIIRADVTTISQRPCMDTTRRHNNPTTSEITPSGTPF